jgi:tetratricopeptide (TPR) repeat protein
MRFTLIILFIMVLTACEVRYSEHRMEPVMAIDESHQEQWLDYLDQQIQSSPRKSENYYRKALILSANNDNEGALQLMRRAIALNPDNLKYRHLMSNLLLQSGDYAAGLKEARLVESYGAVKPGLDQVLGALYLKVGELNRADEHLKKAVQQDPLNDQSHHYMGLLLLAKGDTLLAEEAFVKSLDLKYSPASIQALVNVSIYRKDYQKAFSYLNEILKSDSLNQNLLLQKADLYQATGKLDSAQWIMNRLVKIDSLRPEYYHRLGQIHYISSRFDSAIFYHNKVLQFDRNNTEALVTLARINDRRGFHNMAIDFYEQALVVDSTFQVARDELEKLNSRLAYLQRIRREREIERQNVQPLQEIRPRPIAPPQL